MKTTTDIFAESALFSSLTFDEIKNCARISNAEKKVYAAKSDILSESHNRKSLYFIISGKVNIFKLSGGHSTLLNTLNSGDMFGAAGLFSDKETYPTSIIAKEKTQILEIEYESFINIINKYPQIAVNYIKFLSKKIEFLNDKIDSFTKSGAEGKVAKFLLESTKEKDSFALENVKTKAAELDVSRATLYRIVDKMSENGIIEYNKKGIKVINAQYLKGLAK